MDPNDYHEIGQRHLKYQRLVACFRLVFRAVCSHQGRKSGKTPGGAGTGDTSAGSPELTRQKQTPRWMQSMNQSTEAETASVLRTAQEQSPHGVTADTCQPEALPRASVRAGGRHHHTLFNRDSVQKGLGSCNHDLSDTGLHRIPTVWSHMQWERHWEVDSKIL